MKIRDVITFDREHLFALNSRNRNQGKRMATNSQAPIRSPQFQNAAPLQDFAAHADPIDGVQSGVLPAQNPSLMALSSIPTAHRRDLDFIKAQLARLPPQDE